MYETTTLRIPSEAGYLPIVKHVTEDICNKLFLTPGGTSAILSSLEELIQNAIVHAYKDEKGYIEISWHPFAAGLRVDVQDWGRPMTYKKHTSVPLIQDASLGFNRIYDLMDLFEYHNLGKDGKKFVIIKYAALPLENLKEGPKTDVAAKGTLQAKEIDPDLPIIIREFQEGDEEAVAYLIYKNYGHSYNKDLFYYPRKILEKHGKTFYSVVAEAEGKVIGHFAFVLIPESTIAEVGIVVVHPLFKGRGIMNRMMELLLKKAESVGLDAVFGEAFMYHTFSQKSNLRYGFSESALMIGKTATDVTIKGNELTKSYKRGSVLVGYRFFHRYDKSLYLPKVYQDKIKQTYRNAKLTLAKKKAKKIKLPKHVFLAYKFSPTSNIAKIRIDTYGQDFKQKFYRLVSQLRAKHCDMIYADISLETIEQIDKVVEIVNKRGFFYSGVMFLYHDRTDYLRLQLKHSDKIGTKNCLCHSKFCKELADYISRDEKRNTK